MIRWKALSIVAAAATLVACEGFKEAMSAHVDVAARAGSQELSSERLAQIIGGTKLPLQKPIFEDFAKVWVSYQLLGDAAAHGDSLTDRKAVDDAMWPAIAQAKLQKFYQQVSATLPHDSATEEKYNQGGLLVARHILLLTQKPGSAPYSDQQVDSVRRAAEAIRATVTPSNFASVAKRVSQDPGSAPQGGLLPPFAPGEMVPEFEVATRDLKPGEISPVVRSQFGFHIIQRLPYSEAKDAFTKKFASQSTRGAESTYVAQLEQAGKIEVKKDAPAKVKAIVRDPDAFQNDKTVLATTAIGDFTAAKFERWLGTLPAQVRPQILAAPDTLLPDLVKAMARNELMLHRADSMHVDVDSTEKTQMYAQVKNVVLQMWQALNVDPSSLSQAGKTVADREKIAGERINAYLDDLVAGKKQFVPVPEEIATILRSKYEAKIVQQGIDRAFERAQKARSSADSTSRATQPQSSVPLPQLPQSGAPAPAPSAKP
jgi:hypothetical protein